MAQKTKAAAPAAHHEEGHASVGQVIAKLGEACCALECHHAGCCEEADSEGADCCSYALVLVTDAIHAMADHAGKCHAEAAAKVKSARAGTGD